MKRSREMRGKVTRVFTRTKTVLRCYDTYNHVERPAEITLNGEYSDNGRILDTIRKGNMLEMGLVPLEVTDRETVSELRGMDLDEFIRLSTVYQTESTAENLGKQ